MKIILFGPQGAGKGVYGAELSKKYNLCLLSMGQILRNAIKQGTEIGKIASQYINEGNLVPAQITIDILKERINKEDCKNGFILDGFPRSEEQEELFGEEMNKIDYMIELYAPEEILLRRLTGRRTCEKCGAIYNVYPEFDPNPKEEGKCDYDKAKIVQREDDKPEAIKKRLNIYYTETKPTLEKYKNKVIRIDASLSLKEVVKKIVEAIETNNQ